MGKGSKASRTEARSSSSADAESVSSGRRLKKVKKDSKKRGRKPDDRSVKVCWVCQDESKGYYRTWQKHPHCKDCYNGERRMETQIGGNTDYLEEHRQVAIRDADKHRQDVVKWMEGQTVGQNLKDEMAGRMQDI